MALSSSAGPQTRPTQTFLLCILYRLNMGKRDKSEVEDIVHDDSSKKAKKHKKDKKDNDRVEEITFRKD